MTHHKLAYVVPTKDRPDDMKKLLDSLLTQTRQPDQLIVVDGGDEPIHDLCDRYPSLGIVYAPVRPPSLARQRNVGMAALRDDITIAGYLDDDLVLEPTATEEMFRFWENAPARTGGVSFSIINQPPTPPGFTRRVLGLQGGIPGKVLPTGFASHIPFVTETIETEWLYGGATIWSRDIIRTFSYDEWYVGHGYLEDVDYSYRVSRTHRLFVSGAARVWHFSRPMNPSRSFDFGRQQIFNRMYFMRKLGAFPWWGYAWGVGGQLLWNVLNLGYRRDRAAADRLRGNAAALRALIIRQKNSFEGIYK